MKKHELLKYAYDNYPKGVLCRFKSAPNVDHVSTGKFRIIEGTGNGTCVISDDDNHCFYASDGNEWAQIVNPKIAVKVENEKEFHALMKYYDGLGKKLNNGLKPLAFEVRKINFPMFVMTDDLTFCDADGLEEIYSESSFTEFAKEHNIKLPLLKSEDGVWLYEGDEYHEALLENGIFRYCKGSNHFLNIEARAITIPNESKAFSAKQSALEWIEAQKPKLPEFVVMEKRNIDDYTNTVFSTHVEIDGDFIGLINTGKILRLDKAEIESILDIMNNKVKK